MNPLARLCFCEAFYLPQAGTEWLPSKAGEGHRAKSTRLNCQENPVILFTLAKQARIIRLSVVLLNQPSQHVAGLAFATLPWFP